MFIFTLPVAILIAAAVIPAVWLLCAIYRRDRLEPEPTGLLVSLVLFGILATFAAVVTESIGMNLLERYVPAGFVRSALMYFVVVAVSEEGFKYLLLKRRTWRHPAFNCRFDGVVYATFVSLGFALWENIGYVFRFGLATALARAVTAVPGHACFGVFMGAWYGMAKWYENYGDEAMSKKYRRLSLLVPVLLHGCYDFIATESGGLFTMIFVAFVVVMFCVARRTVIKISDNDQFIGNGDAF